MKKYTYIIALFSFIFVASCSNNDNNESQIEFIPKDTLLAKTSVELRLIRNEIFARHGFVFNSSDLKDFFGKMDWYKENENFSNDNLSESEKKYIEIIKSIEKAKKKEYIFNIDSLNLKEFTWNLTNETKQISKVKYGKKDHESVYDLLKLKANYRIIKEFRITENVSGIITCPEISEFANEKNFKIFFFTTIDNSGNEINTIRLAKYESISDVFYFETGFIKGDIIEIERYFSTIGFEEKHKEKYRISYTGEIIKQ